MPPATRTKVSEAHSGRASPASSGSGAKRTSVATYPGQTPAKLKAEMNEALDAILKAPSPARARAAFGQAETRLEGTGAGAALAVLEGRWEEATAVLALPAKYRRRLRTSNMIERFIEEVRRREKVVPIFPNQRSVWRLVGALCAEQHEEWSTGRCYLKMDEFYRWKTSHEETPSESQPLPVAA